MTAFGAWGAPQWTGPAAILLFVGGLAVLWNYWRSPTGGGVRLAAAALKAVGLAALALALVDPLLTGVRPRRGANIFAIVADDSQSLQIHDAGAAANRGEQLKRTLLADTKWHVKLSSDFDVRRLIFSTQLAAVDDFAALSFNGSGTSLGSSLESLSRRFRGLPIAGVMLLTDGNATDALPQDLPWSDLPPVYPVILGSGDALRDVSIDRASASQVNFETAPVTIRADALAYGYRGQQLQAKLSDEAGKVVASQVIDAPDDGAAASFRFELKPEKTGVSFYTVDVAPTANGAGATENPADEATVANNRRLIEVDRGGGPYRVLYVGGRPNWEFKFLRRALAGDDQLELVGLLRIAKREPKFSFRARGEQSTNQLFEGFEHPDADAAESYDEPVLVRLGVQDEQELRDGFPRSADQLYRFDAIILDDLEASFFTQDQLTLLEDFVSRRGGGLLMLGGAEAFEQGNYRRTPVGDLLPVYLDGPSDWDASFEPQFRLALTREGWLEPWVRLRKTEPEDRRRLAAMPSFRTLNPAGHLKPGATALAEVIDQTGKRRPALAAQRFGRGRSAALLLGDLFRWGLRRANDDDDDLDKAWRQMVRWLVAEVPERVEAEATSADSGAASAVTLQVRVRDAEFFPLDNAAVKISVAAPDGRTIELDAEPDAKAAGAYAATLAPHATGAYRARVVVTAPDGSPVGEREIGWVAQPLVDEFRRLAPSREVLERIAAKTGGQVLEVNELDEFVASLDSRRAPITEPWTRPLWHHPAYFLITIGCLAAEWGLRRWKGLA